MTGKGAAANSVSQEFANILKMSRHSLLQRLRRCTNVILPSLRNRNLIAKTLRKYAFTRQKITRVPIRKIDLLLEVGRFHAPKNSDT
jgi:hypothetical protein